MKIIRKLAVLGLALGSGGLASAMPLTFDVYGAGTSVDATGISLCSGCSATFTPASGVSNEVFTLGVGDSYTFDFFDVQATGPGFTSSGAIGGFVEATLAFIRPELQSTTGTGLGGAAWASVFIFGGGGVGGLTFELGGQPDDIVFSDGSIASVLFSTVGDVCGPGGGCTLYQTVSATVTLQQGEAHEPPAQVPEPGTLALLGLGLLGMSVTRRRKALS